MTSQIDSVDENKTAGDAKPVSDEKWELYAEPDVWRLELDGDDYLYRVGSQVIHVPFDSSDALHNISTALSELVATIEHKS